MKHTRFAMTIVAGLFLGCATGWIARDLAADRDTRTLIAAHDLHQAAFAANTLGALERRSHAALQLQELLLRSAIDNLHRISVEPLRFKFPLDSLVEGLRRAEAYAKSNNMPETAAKTKEVIGRLEKRAA